MVEQDLIITKEARIFLDLGTDDSNDHIIGRLITDASDWIEMMVNRKLKKRTFTDIRLTGPLSRKLYLPAWPISIADPISMTVNGKDQTVWTKESDGETKDFDVIIGSDDPGDPRFGFRNHFFRIAGWNARSIVGTFYTGIPNQNNILMTYSGGFDPVPGDLQLAGKYMVQKLWRDAKQQQTGVTAMSLQGSSFTMPEPTIPKEIKMLLAPYRRIMTVGIGSDLVQANF